MSLDWALAHKLAAWNERSLMRDLYDIYFLHTMLDVLPDRAILKQRLAKINYPGKGKSISTGKKMTLTEFLDKLYNAAQQITPDGVETELRDYFTSEELAGLSQKIKIGVKTLG